MNQRSVQRDIFGSTDGKELKYG